jgi:hypothetical protein
MITDRQPKCLPSGFAEVVASGGTRAAVEVAPPGTQTQVGDAATAAFVASLNEILLIGALVTLAGAVIGFLLVRQRDFVAQPGAQHAPTDSAEPSPVGP